MWYAYVIGISALSTIVFALLNKRCEVRSEEPGWFRFFISIGLVFSMTGLPVVLASLPPAANNNRLHIEKDSIIYNINDGSIGGKVTAVLPVFNKADTSAITTSLCDTPEPYIETMGADKGSAGNCDRISGKDALSVTKSGKPSMIVTTDEKVSYIAEIDKKDISPVEKHIIAYCPGTCTEQDLADQVSATAIVDPSPSAFSLFEDDYVTLRTKDGMRSVTIVRYPLYTAMTADE